MNEVMSWFKKNEVKFITILPDVTSVNIHKLKTIIDDKVIKITKNKFERFYLMFMIFNKYGDDGGLFVLVGKK